MWRAFLLVSLFGGLRGCGSSSASSVALQSPVTTMKYSVIDSRAPTLREPANRSNSKGFKILKSPSASGLRHLCAALDAENDGYDAVQNAQIAERSRTSSEGSTNTPACMDAHDNQALECEKQEIINAPEGLSGPEIGASDRVETEWHHEHEIETERVGCVPTAAFGSVLQWAELLQRWVQGVPTIFEVDDTGCPTLESDIPFTTPRKPAASTRRKIDPTRSNPAACGGSVPPADSIGTWFRSWWRVSRKDSAAAEQQSLMSAAAGLDDLSRRMKLTHTDSAVNNMGSVLAKEGKDVEGAASVGKGNAGGGSGTMQLELLSDEEEGNDGGEGGNDYGGYDGVRLRTTGWAGYGVERGAMEPKGFSADRGFTPSMKRSASVVTPITTPRVSHDNLWMATDQ